MTRATWAFVAAAILALLMVFSERLLAADFTLDQAIDHAMAHNKDLAALRETVPGAEARVDEARATVLPRVKLTGGYQYQSEVPTIDFARPDISVPPGGVGIPTVTMVTEEKKMGAADNWQAQARLDQVLFASGGVAASIKAAREGARASDEQVQASEEDLARQVRESFYTVLFTQAILDAQRESLATAQAHLDDVRLREKNGAASRYEVLRSEIEVANLQPDVDQAANAVLIAKTGFRSLIGLDLDEPVEVRGSLENLEPPVGYQQALADGMDNRHELAALDAGAEAQHKLAWAATSGMLPRLAGYATYNYQKPWYFDNEGQDYWTVGVGLEIPVFDGTAASSKRKEAVAERRHLERQAAATREKIDLAIRRSLLDLSEIDKRVRETADNVKRAQETYGMAETAYRQGVMTNLEVLDAQLALTGARTRHIQAQYDHQIALTRLLAASGRLLP